MTKLNHICVRLLAAFLLLVLGGCASRAEKLFPDVYAAAPPAAIDVLVDVTVINDLSGDDLGVDLQRNRESAAEVREHMDAILANAGYSVRMLRSGYGLAWDPGAAATYLTDGTQSTGLPYPGPEAVGSNDPWIAGDARSFLHTLVMTARLRRDDPDTPETQAAVAALKALAQPLALQQVQGRYLLTIHTTVYDAAAIKEAAAIVGGIAFGAGMAALGSNLVFIPFLATSYANVELVLFDVEAGEVAWSSAYCDTNDGLRRQLFAVREAAAVLPAHPGRKPRLEKAAWKQMQP